MTPEAANDQGNRAAATGRHRRLPFTAWLRLFVELADFYSVRVAPEFLAAKLPGVCVIVIGVNRMRTLGNDIDSAIESEFEISIRLYHNSPGFTGPQEIWRPRSGHTRVVYGETINRHRAAVMASNAGLDEDPENEYCESDCDSCCDFDCGPHYMP